MTFPLETERLLLRVPAPEDLDAIRAVLTDPEVVPWLGGSTPTLEESRTWLGRKIRHHQEHGFGLWAVVEKSSRELVGDCGLQHLEDGPEIEIGWRLRPDRWGRGYATEAAQAALAFGFEEAGLDEIVAVTRPDNARSRRVMEKIGMVYEGLARYYGHQQVKYAIRRVPDASRR